MEKQAKALQSELTFKDHQLTQAQKSHASAMRELGAERGKRKRDREQAERERQEAAAITAEAAAAAAATAAAAALAASAADVSGASANISRGPSASTPGGDGGEEAEEEAPFPTLAEILLSDCSEDVMVLLRAAGGGKGWSPWGNHWRRGGKDGEANSGSSDGDGTGFRMETPLPGKRRRRGGIDSVPSGPYSPFLGAAAPGSVSPAGAGARFRDALGGVDGGFGSGGARRRNDGDVCGASPLPLAFTPSRLAPWERGRMASAVVAAGANDGSAVRGGAPGSSGSVPGVSGVLSAGKVSYADSATTHLSPGRAWEVDWQGGGNACVGGAGGGGGGGGRLEELQGLSSQMFACAMALVEGEACAGDLLDVLVRFLETLPGETVRPGIMYLVRYALHAWPVPVMRGERVLMFCGVADILWALRWFDLWPIAWSVDQTVALG